MGKVLAFLVQGLAATASARSLLEESSSMVNDPVWHAKLNDGNSTWVAGHNEFFNGWTHEKAKGLCGTILDGENTDIPVVDFELIDDSSIPDTFDATTQWPKYIHPIRDQQQCGSCWAFSASEVLSDRFTIASQGAIDVVLSPQDMVACDKTDQGCNGGRLGSAWNYLKNTGIVSDKCDPYTAGDGQSGTCQTKCVDGEAWKKYKATDSFQMRSVSAMQKEIMTNGPIQVAFTVYKSFMSYKSGVYVKKPFEFIPEGGHAVKAVGWGTEDGVDYWLIANSWNTNWGLNGFFKIKRGVNECGIEGQAYAGHAAVSTLSLAPQVE
ncbi:hypothetical protein CYMTET_21203 [Cymbomonas tetramitiformis]|uniref:Peptidase C1A papain C-terminal domain-containing protein n=1 Tax=Cymbomonas tetramitiformis TaxID=36881 RepID=A0AAE0G2M7_9CHLO|nr:hypothetical protein CYMTET_21203 [Cymbomonas tetramitiformis]|eukprot:gene17936-21362_t